MSVTEADICRAYAGLVQAVAARVGGLEHEDAVSTAELGLLKAIRTWRTGVGNFRDFATSRIYQELTTFKRCINQQTRAESGLSLDMQLGPESGGTTYGDVLAIIETDQTVIDVAMFIRALPHREQVFVRLRMRGYDNDGIASLFHTSADAVGELQRTVMERATLFFDS